MKKMAIFAFLLSWLVSSWAWAASPESYLPLKEGMVWEYQNKFIDLKSNEPVGGGKAIKKNLASIDLQGTRVVPQIFSFYQPDETLKQETGSFIAQDTAGFYVFARQGPNDKGPRIIAEKYYILKFPLTKGASWKQTSEGVVLQDIVESTDASVQVPAGMIAGVPGRNTPEYPLGATFTGRAWSEPVLLRLAYAFEQATKARRMPPGVPPLAPACGVTPAP